MKASGGTELAQIETAVDEELARLGAEAPTAEEMERAQALLEREWLDRLGTVAGRADELCRYAMLFGDPQLAFTAAGPDPLHHRRGGPGLAAPRLRPGQPRGAGLRARDPRDRRRPAGSRAGREPSGRTARRRRDGAGQ